MVFLYKIHLLFRMQTSDTEIIEQPIHYLTNQVEINRNANCDVKISGAAVKIKADQFRENFLDSSSSDFV